jgi:hypothetical protein
MALKDGRERFQRAAGILADEKGRIQERLLIAYASQLSRIHPHEDLPQSVLEGFDEIKYGISDADVPYGYGQRAAVKIDALSEGEASRYAQKIFSMFLNLVELEAASRSTVEV